MKTKIKRLTKVTNYNIAKDAPEELHINAPKATLEEIEQLLRTTTRISVLSFIDTVLPRYWETIRNIDRLDIYTNEEEINLDELDKAKIFNIKLTAPNLKKLPANLFNSEYLVSLILNCPKAQSTDAITFNLPDLHKLNFNAPLFNIDFFANANKCLNIHQLQLHIRQMKEIPICFLSANLRHLGLHSEKMYKVPPALKILNKLLSLTIDAPLNDEIKYKGDELNSLNIQNAESISFAVDTPLQLNHGLHIHAEEIKKLPVLKQAIPSLSIRELSLSPANKISIQKMHVGSLQFHQCKNIDIDFLESLNVSRALVLKNCGLKSFDYEDLKQKLRVHSLQHHEELLTFDNIDKLLKDKKPKKYSVQNIYYRGGIHFNDPTVLITKKYISLYEHNIVKPKECNRETHTCLSIFKLGREIAKAPRLKEADRKRLFLHFWNQGGALVLPESFQDNLKLLSVNYLEIIQAVKKEIIDTIIDKKLSLDSSCQVFINGRPDMAKTELKEKAQASGLRIHTKATTGITHMLICDKPHFTNFEIGDYSYISEESLRQFLNNESPGFLTEEESSPEMTANIEQFLNSPDTTNLILGLNMIQSGGLPESLFEKILVIAKTHEDNKVRRAAAKAMKTYGPENLVNIVKTTQTFKKKGEHIPQMNRFNLLEKKLNIREIFELNFILYKYGIRNLRYVLCHKNPDTRMLHSIIKYVYESKGELNFGKLVGNFTKHSHKFSTKLFFHPEFPTDDYIENLDFQFCKFRKFPEDILRFKNVKKLSLRNNHIRTLPPSFAQLTKLEELDLRDNNFMGARPKILDKMPLLKHLLI